MAAAVGGTSMVRLAFLAAAAALVLGPDVLCLQAAQQNPPAVSQGQSVPALPKAEATSDSASGATPTAAQGADQQNGAVKLPDVTQPQKDTPMQEESRMQILRSVDGEFAKLLTPLPGGRKGFHLQAGEPIDQNALRKAIQTAGAALNNGDNVQITRFNFLGRGMVIDLNGGGKKQGSWKDHVQMQIGIPEPVETSSQTSDPNARPVIAAKKTGATIFLDFDRNLPDMTPEQVKQYLSNVLDFSKQRSATVQWTDTLPPKVRDAIADKRPVVGMDRDEVMAAIGRPDRKVREQEADGTETEDWIYGRPPAKTIFVEFIGDKVTKIDSYPD